MSGKAPALVKSWQVGRYTATLVAPKPRRGAMQSVVIEWSPEQPSRLTEGEVAQYRAGRDEAFRALGLSTLVIEL